MSELPATPASFDPHEALAEASWVRRLARGLVSDRTRADDVEQETWLAILRQRGRRVGELRAWTAAVARARAIDERRSEERRVRREQGAARAELQPSVEELSARADQQRRLVAHVMELDEIYREVVLRHYFDGQRLDLIARNAGVPATTIRTRLARALETLRERLDRESRGDRGQWMSALAPVAALHGGASGLPTAVQLAIGSVLVVGASLMTWWAMGAGRQGIGGVQDVARAQRGMRDESLDSGGAPPAVPGGERGLALALERSAAVAGPGLVYGTLVDERGAPVSEAKIELERDGEVLAGGGGAIGTWAAMGVSAGAWLLRAESPGCVPVRRTLEVSADPDTRRVDLVLARATRLEVRFVDEQGAPVTFAPRGPLGRSALGAIATALPPGENLANVAGESIGWFGCGRWLDESFSASARQLAVKPKPGEPTILEVNASLPVFVSAVLGSRVLRTQRVGPGSARVDFVLSPEELAAACGAVHATVVDASGRAVEAGRVQLTRADSTYPSYAEVLPDGSLSWTGIAPGIWRLNASSEVGGLARVVHVPSARTLELGTLQLSDKVAVEGRVVDASGAPLSLRADALELRPDTSALELEGRTVRRSDSDGKFRFELCARERVWLRFQGDGHALTALAVDPSSPGARELVVRVQGGVPVTFSGAYDRERRPRLTVRDEHGVPLGTWSSWNDQGLQLRLAPGAYVASLGFDERELVQQRFVVADEPVRVALDLGALGG